MTDNLPPLPPFAPEFQPRWPNDPGGYTAEQMQAYARAAIEKDRERQIVPAGWYITKAEAMADAEEQAIGASAPQPQPVPDRQSVPNGWKLVPIEPTDEMIDATYAGQHCSDIWRDMIAAAPQPVPHSQFGSPELGAMILARCVEKDRQPQPVQQLELTEYDAGLLNDFGGGNVEWWQDYIRAELGRAFEHYQSQVPAQGEKQ